MHTSQPWVSVVCRKLSCPHARGALGCEVALIASGCIRLTFLVRTTSRSGCSQLSQAYAAALKLLSTQATVNKRILKVLTALHKGGREIGASGDDRGYLTYRSTLSVRVQRQTILGADPSSAPSPKRQRTQWCTIGPPTNVISRHVDSLDAPLLWRKTKASATIGRFSRVARKLVMLDCGDAQATFLL